MVTADTLEQHVPTVREVIDDWAPAFTYEKLTIELASFNPDHESKAYDMKDIDWIARILWASQ